MKSIIAVLKKKNTFSSNQFCRTYIKLYTDFYSIILFMFTKAKKKELNVISFDAFL